MRYRVEHEKIKFISTSGHVIFYYINIPMTMIFRRFPTTFRRFLKIFQNCCEGQTNVSDHFPDISHQWRDLINFLDVTVVLNDGIVSTDVYSKPTDKHQYLFHTWCHPNSCKKGIRFGHPYLFFEYFL